MSRIRGRGSESRNETEEWGQRNFYIALSQIPLSKACHGAPGFEQSFQMRLGRLLESKGGLATIAPVRVAAGQPGGFGNPHAIFILTELHFREWNDHNGHKVTCSALDVKEAMFPRRSRPRLNLSTFNPQPSTG